MITLEDNQLKFTFPEIIADLRHLIDAEIDQLIPAFLAEDRVTAVRDYVRRQYWYRSVPETYKQGAIQALQSLTAEKVRQAIWEQMRLASNLVPGEKDEPHATIEFQRTLRIPDDGKTYPLPPGLGCFPLVPVDDGVRVPDAWKNRGGVMMPMYEAEALWLSFDGDYPCAIKVATGQINAVSGLAWTPGLCGEPQDYVVRPRQPWLDGYNVGQGLIRQFVAMPLGDGYSVEEQLTGRAEHGGLQIQVYPVRAEVCFDHHVRRSLPDRLSRVLEWLLPPLPPESVEIVRERSATIRYLSASVPGMGLGTGGTMRQEIYRDTRPPESYDLAQSSRCCIHLCNAPVWRAITNSPPPPPPVSADTYTQYGLPWFDFYRADLPALEGSGTLAAVQSVADLHGSVEGTPLANNESVSPAKTVQLGNANRPREIREWKDEEKAQ